MPITRSNEKKGTYRREVGQVPSANNPGWPQQVITEARLQVRRSLGQRVKMVEGSGPTRGLKCLIRPVVIGYGKVISPSPFLSLKRVVVRVIQRVLLLIRARTPTPSRRDNGVGGYRASIFASSLGGLRVVRAGA